MSSLIESVCKKESVFDFITPPDPTRSSEILEKIQADLHTGQARFFEDTTTEILGLCAGYGSGKSFALFAKCVQLAILNMGYTGCVFEPTNVLVRDIFIRGFNEFLEQYGISYSFRASPLPEYTLHLEKPTTLLCRSFENYNRIVGLNLSHVVCDELDVVAQATCQMAFPRILARLRDGNVRQFAAASTPEGFRFFYNTFGTEEAQARTDRKLVKMTTYENKHLPKDFIDRLEANYEPALLKSYLLGEFVNITQGCVYTRFDREKHLTTEIPDLTNEIIHVGIDFNIGKMSGILGVIKNEELYIFDEIRAYDTDELGKTIRAKFPRATVYGYPDASGGARSANSSKTDIQILGNYKIYNQSGASNPAIADRVNAVQALLENGKGQIRFHIHPRCKEMIKSLELQSYDDKGQPSKDSGHDHFADALGYIIWRRFNPLHLNAGKSTGIRIY